MTQQTPVKHYAASSEDECPWCELDGDRNAHTDPEYGQGTDLATASVAEVGSDDGWPALLCWCGHTLHLPDCESDLGEADTCAARFRFERAALAPAAVSPWVRRAESGTLPPDASGAYAYVPVARCGRSDPHRTHTGGPGSGRYCVGNLDVIVGRPA